MESAVLLIQSSGNGGNNWGGGIGDDYWGRGDNNDGDNYGNDNNDNNNWNNKFIWPLSFIGVFALAIWATMLGNDHPRMEWSMGNIENQRRLSRKKKYQLSRKTY